jgi:CheY-like chemotaxis protein
MKKLPVIIPDDKGIIVVAKKMAMKPRILIADDDEGIRDIFKILLEKEGYELQLKENGQDLLADKFSLPDLFLIDKQLSGVSGLDVCRHLKSRKQTRNIPVIIISASPDIVQLSHEAGADNCLEKPFELKSLLKMISQYLEPGKKTRLVKTS